MKSTESIVVEFMSREIGGQFGAIRRLMHRYHIACGGTALQRCDVVLNEQHKPMSNELSERPSKACLGLLGACQMLGRDSHGSTDLHDNLYITSPPQRMTLTPDLNRTVAMPQSQQEMNLSQSMRH